MSIKGTGVTAYTVTGTTSRRIEGKAEINGVAGTYTVEVSDGGTSDSFAVRLSTGDSAKGPLSGGNIILHLRAPCP